MASNSLMCPELSYTILRSVTILLEGTLAIQLASVWTWRLWRKNPFDSRHPIPIGNPPNCIMRSNSFLSDLKDMVRHKNTPSALLILVWVVELGTSFCFAACMFHLPMVSSAFFGHPGYLFRFQKIVVALCSMLECVLMAGAIWTHIREKHRPSASICAIAVLVECLIILSCEQSTFEREGELLLTGQQESFIAIFPRQNLIACEQQELFAMSMHSSHVANYALVPVAIFLRSHVLMRQNVIAVILFLSCTAMVAWALVTGLYLELLCELGCYGSAAREHQRKMSYERHRITSGVGNDLENDVNSTGYVQLNDESKDLRSLG